jgi:hypothetical protein
MKGGKFSHGHEYVLFRSIPIGLGPRSAQQLARAILPLAFGDTSNYYHRSLNSVTAQHAPSARLPTVDRHLIYLSSLA